MPGGSSLLTTRGEYVACANFRFDFLRRSARFGALHFHGQQVLRGPVFIGAQFKGEAKICTRNVFPSGGQQTAQLGQ